MEPIPTPDTQLTGVLLLPVETVAEAGTVFPLLALMLRSAGMQVLVVGKGTNRDVEQKAAAFHVPFTEVKESTLTGKPFQDWKFSVAMHALKSGPVIWADLDFAHSGERSPTLPTGIGSWDWQGNRGNLLDLCDRHTLLRNGLH